MFKEEVLKGARSTLDRIK